MGRKRGAKLRADGQEPDRRRCRAEPALLDEVDKVLERQGHCFARYADDCNVYVRSRKAGERVMGLLRKCYERLHLKVNEAKSAVADVRERKFLGFSFWYAQGEVRRRVADQPMATFKQRIRQLTRRSGRSQSGRGHRAFGALPHGMESLLRVGANPRRPAQAGRMGASPVAGNPTQALAARQHDPAGTDPLGRE